MFRRSKKVPTVAALFGKLTVDELREVKRHKRMYLDLQGYLRTAEDGPTPGCYLIQPLGRDGWTITPVAPTETPEGAEDEENDQE